MVKNEIEWQKATFEWGDNIAEMAYFSRVFAVPIPSFNLYCSREL